jgi:limonene-1,2-epoxide hydrolase
VTPEEVVRAELDAWSRLDVDEIMSCFTDGAVWDNVPFGPVSGRDAIRKPVQGYVDCTTSGNIEILNLAVAGNVVLTERVDHFQFDSKTFDAGRLRDSRKQDQRVARLFRHEPRPSLTHPHGHQGSFTRPVGTCRTRSSREESKSC